MSGDRHRRTTQSGPLDSQAYPPLTTRQRAPTRAGEPADVPAAAEPAPAHPGITVPALPVVSLNLREAPPRETTRSIEPAKVEHGVRNACLVVLAGPREGEMHKLGPSAVLVIGRAPTADLCLDDAGVSRAHVRISVTDRGIVVEDLGSRNGTYVGPRRIQRQLIQGEEVIRVGATSVIKVTSIDPMEEQFQTRLRAAALRDPLTGVYNRRHFDQVMLVESAAARRHGRRLSLVILDLDDFKRINDQHGHSGGDVVLQAVTQAMLSSGRQEDQVFRTGGEEFAIVVRETGQEGAMLLADRLRRQIAARPVTVPSGESVRVTVSMGVAELTPGRSLDAASQEQRRPDSRCVQELIDRADRALYAAKRAGKDRVMAAVDDPTPAG